MSDVVSAERDLYRLLLQLEVDAEPADLLPEVLRLLACVIHASATHAEVISTIAEVETTSFSHDATNHGDATVLRELLARVYADGRALHLASARHDIRFRNVPTAQQHAVDAVLCMPFTTWNARGLVYAHRCDRPDPFSDADRKHVDLVARKIAASSLHFVPPDHPKRGTLHEQTRALHQRLVREALAKANGNVAAAARRLGVTRSFIYSMVPMMRIRG
jgi:hypothetical protein